ncbi:MAG: GNAT family N-acetyltransferase [Clostridia bacterium]|nr:GNAT family N-acetyltransferase [Clostridia bacterium]
MLSFSIESLSLSQVRTLYGGRMREDFPPAELKALALIEQALERQQYVCYGAVDGEEILAYAYFAMLKEQGRPYALFDYFAVKKELRDQGVGSRFLQALIAGPLREMDCVLLEVDDPACAETPEEADIRNRRLAFYLRNGLRDADVKATVFGVQFKILTLPVSDAVPRNEVRRKYAALYRALLPRRLFEANVFIHADD